jgi:hypothetical protein
MTSFFLGKRILASFLGTFSGSFRSGRILLGSTLLLATISESPIRYPLRAEIATHVDYRTFGHQECCQVLVPTQSCLQPSFGWYANASFDFTAESPPANRDR